MSPSKCRIKTNYPLNGFCQQWAPIYHATIIAVNANYLQNPTVDLAIQSLKLNLKPLKFIKKKERKSI